MKKSSGVIMTLKKCIFVPHHLDDEPEREGGDALAKKSMALADWRQCPEILAVSGQGLHTKVWQHNERSA